MSAHRGRAGQGGKSFRCAAVFSTTIRSPSRRIAEIRGFAAVKAAKVRKLGQTEGLLRSLASLLGLEIGIPDHTTFSRRSPGLALASALAQAQRTGPVHVVINATGLSVRPATVRAESMSYGK